MSYRGWMVLSGIIAVMAAITVVPALIHRDIFKRRALTSGLGALFFGVGALTVPLACLYSALMDGVSYLGVRSSMTTFYFRESPVVATVALLVNCAAGLGLGLIAREMKFERDVWLGRTRK